MSVVIKTTKDHNSQFSIVAQRRDNSQFWDRQNGVWSASYVHADDRIEATFGNGTVSANFADIATFLFAGNLGSPGTVFFYLFEEGGDGVPIAPPDVYSWEVRSNEIPSSSDKTGFILAPTGLDSIPVARPASGDCTTWTWAQWLLCAAFQRVGGWTKNYNGLNNTGTATTKDGHGNMAFTQALSSNADSTQQTVGPAT